MRIFKGAMLIIMLTALMQSKRAYCRLADGFPDAQFNQSIGMVNIPTADLLKHGEMRMSLNAGFLSLGIFDYYEMGLIAFSSGSKFYWGNRLAGKLTDEQGIIPAIAVGAESITEDPQLKDAPYLNSYYMVASHNLGVFGTAHLGVGNGRFIGSGEVSSRLNGVFFGVEKMFFEDTPFPLTLKLEEDGRDVNFGMMIRILSGLHMVASIYYLDNVMYGHPAPNDNVVYYLGFSLEAKLSPIEREISEVNKNE
jgi:hypothetical protein